MGIEKWATGEWKANKCGTKMYKAYFDSIKDRLSVVFYKVKAHSGNEYNEEADRLAKNALGINKGYIDPYSIFSISTLFLFSSSRAYSSTL